MSAREKAILEIVTHLHSTLKSVCGEADDMAIAAGEAMFSAGVAIDDVGKKAASGSLLRQLGAASKDVGETLKKIEDIACSGSSRSLGLQAGFAETLLMESDALGKAAASMKSSAVPEEHTGAAERLQQKIADTAFEYTASGLDLLTHAGAVQPTTITFGTPAATVNCAIDSAAAPDPMQSGNAIFEPDYEAADATVRCAKNLIVETMPLLTETVAFIMPILAFFGCAAQCATCNTISAPAAPAGGGGLTIRNNGAGFFLADQDVDWTVCCCNMCWLFWTDFWSYTKTTTITWNTNIPTTRPIGAATMAARRVQAAKIAAAPPPAPVCP